MLVSLLPRVRQKARWADEMKKFSGINWLQLAHERDIYGRSPTVGVDRLAMVMMTVNKCTAAVSVV